MKLEPLGNFVQITSGQIMTRIVAKENETVIGVKKVVIPKAITSDGFVSIEDMPEENLKCEPPSERITQVDDIVIKLSTPFDSAIITNNSADCVVPSFCAIIRNNGQLDLGYLYAFLSSKLCKDQLKEKVTGAVMSILSVGKIQSVLIPVPEIIVQRKIGQDFLAKKEQLLLMKQIIELENKRNDIIFQELK